MATMRLPPGAVGLCRAGGRGVLIHRGGDKWEVTRVCVDGYLW